MSSHRYFRFPATVVIVLGSLAFAGCPPDYQYSKNNLGQDAVQRHYDAGEMSEAQYAQAMRSFDPAWQPKKPGDLSGNVTPAGADKPASPH